MRETCSIVMPMAAVWLLCVLAVVAKGEEPLAVSGARQLFVDDYLIARMTNCRQIVHPGKKDPRNPIGPYCHGGTILTETDGTYRMWYSDPAQFKPAGGVEGRLLISSDGIRWEEPELGMPGLTEGNNVFMPLPTGSEGQPLNRYWYSPSVFYDEMTTDPGERYKLGIWGFNGLCVGFSGDGIHWKLHEPLPVTALTRDVLAPCWDPIRKRFQIYCQVNVHSAGYLGRVAGMAWSGDFRKWNWAGVVLRPDQDDPPGMQIHSMAAFWYESVFLGLVQMFQTQPGRTTGKIGVEKEIGYMNIQLATSRDGLHWRRAPKRTPIIPFGSRKMGDFDAGYIITSQGPIRVGDELWLYYSGASWPQYTRGLAKHPKDIQEAQKKIALRRGMGIIKWRLDRFVSVRADDQPGSLLSKPLLPGGGALIVNADASRGRLLVEILDNQGRVIPGFGKQDCSPITTDSLRHVVRFQDKSKVPRQPAGKPIRLRFHLEKADLYSFQFKGAP